MLTCKICGVTDATLFYKSIDNHCKEHCKDYVKANRASKVEQYRAYEKQRNALQHRVNARDDYMQTPQGKASHARSLLRMRDKYPEKYAARVMLGNAVRDGKIIPWPVCAMPECDRKPEAHHPDYSRPLDVVWLCQAHHKQVHAMVKS